MGWTDHDPYIAMEREIDGLEAERERLVGKVVDLERRLMHAERENAELRALLVEPRPDTVQCPGQLTIDDELGRCVHDPDGAYIDGVLYPWCKTHDDHCEEP